MLPLQVAADGFDISGIHGVQDHLAVGLLSRDRICGQAQIVGMRGQQRIVFSACQCAVAGPAVVARIGDHRGAQRIEFDVAMAMHEVVTFADQACLVAAFPQRAAAVVRVVDVANIPPSKRLECAGQGIRLPRRQQQVYVVSHQDVGVHRAALAQGDFP